MVVVVERVWLWLLLWRERVVVVVVEGVVVVVVVEIYVSGDRVPLFRSELQGVLIGALKAAAVPAVSAQSHILVVATDFHLVSVGDDAALVVDAGIYYGLAPAGAGRFDFVDGIGNLKEALGAFKKVGAEVGAETVAHHVAAIVIDDTRELIYLTARQELSLIDENPVFHHESFLESGLGKLIEVGIGINPEATSLNSYSGAYHIVAFAIVDDWFHAQVFHATFLKVVGSGQKQGCFSRAHCSVAEV